MASDPNGEYDPNDPAAVIRRRALDQVATTDPTAPATTTTPTPSPDFAPVSTTQPAGTARVDAPTQTTTADQTPSTPSSPFSVYQAYRSSHTTPGTGSLDDLVKAYQGAGIDASRYMYGATPSGNELSINGQKTKFTVGDAGDPSAYWYDWGSPDGPATPATGTPMAAQANPFLDQIRQMLLERLGRDSQPVDPNDVTIAQPMSAASDQASRSQDQERKVLAERLFAQGGGNVDGAALTQGIQQSAEKNALGLGSLKAQLITQALTAKRTDLSDAMQLAIASGDAESARSISLQLAALDAQLRREGMGVNLAISEGNQNAGTVYAGAGR